DRDRLLGAVVTGGLLVIRKAEIGRELRGHLSAMRPDMADVTRREPQPSRGGGGERREEEDAEVVDHHEQSRTNCDTIIAEKLRNLSTKSSTIMAQDPGN